MKASRFLPTIIGVLFCLLFPQSVFAMPWYVDASATESGDGTSWETAFKAIQEGIDAASDGDTVIVAEGTYVENIHFGGKNFTLRSSDPLDPGVVANTVIDGSKLGSVVRFRGTEDESCILSGFTIRNGTAQNGGGVSGQGTRATIEENLVAYAFNIFRFFLMFGFLLRGNEVERLGVCVPPS